MDELFDEGLDGLEFRVERSGQVLDLWAVLRTIDLFEFGGQGAHAFGADAAAGALERMRGGFDLLGVVRGEGSVELGEAIACVSDINAVHFGQEFGFVAKGVSQLREVDRRPIVLRRDRVHIRITLGRDRARRGSLGRGNG